MTNKSVMTFLFVNKYLSFNTNFEPKIRLKNDLKRLKILKVLIPLSLDLFSL